jgi:DtxR family Mn-dependent transcriptional regulator
MRVLAEQGVRPGAVMDARLVEGSVSLDGEALPVGVAQHVFVSVTDEELSPLEAAPLV